MNLHSRRVVGGRQLDQEQGRRTTPNITNRGKSREKSKDQLGNRGKRDIDRNEVLLSVLVHRMLVQFIMSAATGTAARPTSYRHLKLRRRIVRIISIGRGSQEFYH